MRTPITRIQSLINTCYWLCKILQSLPHSDLQEMQVHVRGVSGAGYINASSTYAIHTNIMSAGNTGTYLPPSSVLITHDITQPAHLLF